MDRPVARGSWEAASRNHRINLLPYPLLTEQEYDRVFALPLTDSTVDLLLLILHSSDDDETADLYRGVT